MNLKVALVGNPNVGKTSLFNQLTGLNQKVGNYPGITVDQKIGKWKDNETSVQLIDLPGTYSLFPSSKDEELVFNVLTDKNSQYHPDKVVVVADASSLKRSLLLFQQVRDLGLPTLLVLNMIDESEKKGQTINTEILAKSLGISTVIVTNARTQRGIAELKKTITTDFNSTPDFVIPFQYRNAVEEVQQTFHLQNPYIAWHYLTQKEIHYLHKEDIVKIEDIYKKYQIIPKRLQVKETIDRYAAIDTIVNQSVEIQDNTKPSLTDRLDAILVHKVWGVLIFLGILFVVFQALFTWSSVPMDWIDEIFGNLSGWVSQQLPAGPLNSLVADGIIPGIGGVLIFVPQIVILFLFLSLMEESGYMSRAVFLMDRIMRPFGLSGKSVVPLISGVACAIPAVMAARNIENNRERLLTVLVTPFMTCSARLPVYAFVISIIVPNGYWGIFNIQALALMCMYALGVIAALLGAFILKHCIKSDYKSFLILEMPNYKIPMWKNVLHSVRENVQSFILGAGKIIVAVTILLWFLGTHGSHEDFGQVAEIVDRDIELNGFSPVNQQIIQDEYQFQLEELQKNHAVSQTTKDSLLYEVRNTTKEQIIQSEKLQKSYLGAVGRFIEPVVKPLGYDWKMGVGLVASIAAREVFVGTLASIYSLGDVDDSAQSRVKIKHRLEHEINPNTGKPIINKASGASLLVFYAFAMQCISTLAAVRRETKSWKWPMFQLLFMSGLAYISAFLVYQFMS